MYDQGSCTSNSILHFFADNKNIICDFFYRLLLGKFKHFYFNTVLCKHAIDGNGPIGSTMHAA